MGSRALSLGGDNIALNECADQLIAVTTDRGFPYYRAWVWLVHQRFDTPDLKEAKALIEQM